MKEIISFILFVSLFILQMPAFSLVASVNEVIIPAGTPVIIKSVSTINSKTMISGSIASFVVERDVKIRDKTVIKAGSEVKARILYARKNGMVGKPGVIQISDFDIKAVDGTSIPIRASFISNGKDKSDKVLSTALLFGLPFLMIKGGNAKIPAGTVKTVFTDLDTNIILKEGL
jgi:hypothetical protein